MLVCAPGAQGVREVLGSPRTGVIDGHEPPCGSWELNPGPWQAQQVLVTVEPSYPALALIHF